MTTKIYEHKHLSSFEEKGTEISPMEKQKEKRKKFVRRKDEE